MACAISGRTATVTLGRGNGRNFVRPQARDLERYVRGAGHRMHAPPARVRFGRTGRWRPPPSSRHGDAARLRRRPARRRDQPRHVARSLAVTCRSRDDLQPGLDSIRYQHGACRFRRRTAGDGARRRRPRSCASSANKQGYYIRGDVKITASRRRSTTASRRGDADAEVRMQATLDDAARGNLGFELARLPQRACAGQDQRPRIPN